MTEAKNSETPDITQMLGALSGGNRQIVDKLLPVLYGKLHQMAERVLRRERDGHTLNATALINEAYIKLVDQQEVSWQNRAHFMGVASLAMRRILINYAQTRLAQKRGGGAALVTYNEEVHQRINRTEELLELDEALKRLEKINERQASVVQMWFFGGLTHEEIAEALGVSLPTIRRDWRLARAWLVTQLRDFSVESLPPVQD